MLLLVLTAWLGVRALLAQRHLLAARAELEAARTALLDRRLDEGATAVARASHETSSAGSLTSDPVWRAASLLPVVGRTFSAVAGVAAGADRVAREVLPPALEAVRSLDLSALRGSDGRIDLAMISRSLPALRSTAARAASVRSELAQVPDTLLLPGVGTARRSFGRQVNDLASGLRAAVTAAELAPTLLGQDRPRRYFLLVQQAAESRGTGGVPGGYAVLETTAGRFSVTRQGSNADLEPRLGARPIAPARSLPRDFVDHYGPLGGFSTWANVNLSPDLPTVAQVVEQRWTSQGGQPLDGVVALDARALALMLKGTPPLPTGGGQTVAVDRIEQFLSVEQYKGIAPAPDQTARKERLEVVAAAAVQRLVGGVDTGALVQGLVEAVSTGHLRMASDDPALAPALAKAGIDGALPQGPAPVAYPVVFSSTGGKLDTFLHRRLTYRADSCQGKRRSSTITLRLRSDPPDDLPPYVTVRADDPSGQSRTNQVFASVYATRGATLRRATLDGRMLSTDGSRGTPELQPASEKGLPVWGTLVDLPPGQERILRLELDEPVVPGRVRVPVQPLALPLPVDVDAETC